MTALLSLDNVYAGYGHSRVLHGMSLHVNAGEFVTLLGRNGMGKSTTVKCMVGLLRAQSGTLHLDGRDITRSASHQIARSGIGLVPEGRQIFPNLSVEENLLATARVPKATRSPWNLARVYELFPRLQERRSNPGTRLSGGEQQMLAIGRALMTNPSLLVLDEATEGLAPVVREEIWKALGELRAQGLSMIVVDKNIGALLTLADRHYILEKGRVAWTGNSEELEANSAIVQRHLSV